MTVPPAISYDEFRQIAPDAYKALIAMGKSVDDGGLDKALTELVKIRVSQINRCAFCLKLHIDVARRLKIEQAKLDLVAVWREADCYDAREMAALAWAEHLTGMKDAAVPPAAFSGLSSVFSEAEATLLTVAVANINAWNRIAGALRFTPL